MVEVLMEIDPAQKVRSRLVATLMVVVVVLLEVVALVWIDRTSNPIVSHERLASAADARQGNPG